MIGDKFKDKEMTEMCQISTWQSLQNHQEVVSQLDYLIIDEVQRFASEETSAIINASTSTCTKISLSGTLPESPVMKMQLLGLFGLPKTYITPRQLIDRGLATDVRVNVVKLKYSVGEEHEYKTLPDHHKKLTFIKEHELRTQFCVDLMLSKTKGTDNLLGLFQHSQHGYDMFRGLMKKKFPDVEVEQKHITGKKSFEFQAKHNIFFLNGTNDTVTREKVRMILEEREGAVLVANYALLAAGVSIKKLHHLVFLSGMKVYQTITQSIGRLLRLHKDKTIANLYDVVDMLPPFIGQYKHRLKTSYQRENYQVFETNIDLIAYYNQEDW